VAKRVLIPIAAAAAVLLVVLSGCGGSGGNETPTKAEFARKGEAICGKLQSEKEEHIAKLAKEAQGKVPSVAQREATLLETVGSYEKVAGEIGELSAPAGDEKKVEAIVAAMKESAENVKADPGTSLTNSEIAFKKANSLLAAYGIKGCEL